MTIVSTTRLVTSEADVRQRRVRRLLTSLYLARRGRPCPRSDLPGRPRRTWAIRLPTTERLSKTVSMGSESWLLLGRFDDDVDDCVWLRHHHHM